MRSIYTINLFFNKGRISCVYLLLFAYYVIELWVLINELLQNALVAVEVLGVQRSQSSLYSHKKAQYAKGFNQKNQIRIDGVVC